MTRRPQPPLSNLQSAPDAPATRKPRFDLTSAAGIAGAATLLVGGGASTVAMAPIVAIAAPIAYLVLQISRTRTSASSNSPSVKSLAVPPARSVASPSQQQEIAVAILEAGRKSGLSEVEIVLEGEAGVDIGVNLPKSLNIDMKIKAGKQTKTTIRAKYRDA